MLFLFVL